MKFILSHIILISSCLSLYSVYPYGGLNTPEPFHLLFFLYSKLHNQQPKNAAPNTTYQEKETLFEAIEMTNLLASSLEHSNSVMEDIQRACEHDLYLQHLLIFERPQNYISEPKDPYSELEHPLSKPYNDILLPIQYDNSNSLLSVNSFGNLTLSKTKKFIETKVTAMKLQGFNL